MIIKSNDGQFYPDLYMYTHLLLEGQMVTLSLNYPPWNPITEYNLKIFIE